MRAVAAALLGLALLVGCSDEPEDAPAPGRLDSVDSWGIQLQGLGREGAVDRLAASGLDLLVIDRVTTERGEEEFPLASAVRTIRAGGPEDRRVLAYVNVGQAEEYRVYWGADWNAPAEDRPGNPDFILAVDPDGWSGNYPVAYWDPRWRPVLFGAPDSLVDGAIREGFDGVMLDWVAAFEDPTARAAAEQAGVDPADAMAALVRDLAAHARKERPEFVVVVLNAARLFLDRENGGVLDRPGLAEHVDGLVQESFRFRGDATDDWNESKNADLPLPGAGDSSTAAHVRRLKAVRYLGVRVFTLDYATRPLNVSAAVRLARKCGFVPFVSRTPLDRLPPHSETE